MARVIYDDCQDFVSLVVIVDCQSYYYQLTCFCRHISDVVRNITEIVTIRLTLNLCGGNKG